MDKNIARKIADSLTWARIWSAIPTTAICVLHILFCDRPATEQSGA